MLPLDHDPQGAGLYTRRLSTHQAVVCRRARAAERAEGARCRQVRQDPNGRRGAQEHVRQSRAAGTISKTRKRHHDRILLRLLQPVDLSRVHQHPAAREGAWREDRVAADAGRRHLQHRQQDHV